jgi:hypothetical protein
MTVPPTSIPQPARARSQRWQMVTLAAIALAAIALAIGSWFRSPGVKTSTEQPAPVYTAQQTAEAKAAVCAAFTRIDHALGVAAARNGGSDPTAGLAVATSTRQVFEVGSRYLLTKLSEEPATPADIAAAARKLAGGYQEAVVDYLAGVTETELKPTLNASDDATLSLRQLCK